MKTAYLRQHLREILEYVTIHKWFHKLSRRNFILIVRNKSELDVVYCLSDSLVVAFQYIVQHQASKSILSIICMSFRYFS